MRGGEHVDSRRNYTTASNLDQLDGGKSVQEGIEWVTVWITFFLFVLSRPVVATS